MLGLGKWVRDVLLLLAARGLWSHRIAMRRGWGLLVCV